MIFQLVHIPRAQCYQYSRHSKKLTERSLNNPNVYHQTCRPNFKKLNETQSPNEQINQQIIINFLSPEDGSNFHPRLRSKIIRYAPKIVNRNPLLKHISRNSIIGIILIGVARRSIVRAGDSFKPSTRCLQRSKFTRVKI